MFVWQAGKFASLKTVREQFVNNCIGQPLMIIGVKRLGWSFPRVRLT